MATTEDFKRMFSSEIERIWIDTKRPRSAVVYLFENLKMPEVYVGTTIDVKERLANHIRSVENEEDCHFYRAIRKYGWGSFEFFILESGLTQAEGYVMEKKWIKILDSYINGYNSTPGGEGFSCGDGHSQSRKIKAMNLYTREEFHLDWIGGVKELLGVEPWNASRVLTGEIEYACNIDKDERFIFKYEEDETPWNFSIVTRKDDEDAKNIKIVAYKDGELFKTYKSTEEAATELQILKTSITNCLRKRSKSAGGYIFVYEDQERVKTQRITPVFYMKDGQKVSFENIKNAAISTLNGLCVDYRARQIRKSIKSQLPDPQGIQWSKS